MMVMKLLIINIVIYLLFAFLSLALIFNLGNIHYFNVEISRYIQLFHLYELDVFLAGLTFLASGETCVLFSAAFSAYCYKYFRPVYLVIWLFMVGVVLELFIKYLVYMPPVDLDKRDIFYLGLTVETNYSYPSGHALRSIFFGVFLAYFAIVYLRWNRYATIVAAGMTTFLLLYSRSYLGVHWFVDVVGGALLGLGLAMTAIIIMRYRLALGSGRSLEGEKDKPPKPVRQFSG